MNDVQVQGAVFCIGDLFTMWNIKSWEELEPNSLSILQLFKPAPGNDSHSLPEFDCLYQLYPVYPIT